MAMRKVGILFHSDKQPKRFTCPYSCKKIDKDGHESGDQYFLTSSSFLEHMRNQHGSTDRMASYCIVMDLKMDADHKLPGYYTIIEDFNMSSVRSPNYKTNVGGGGVTPIAAGVAQLPAPENLEIKFGEMVLGDMKTVGGTKPIGGGGTASDVGGGTASDVGGVSASDVGGMSASDVGGGMSASDVGGGMSASDVGGGTTSDVKGGSASIVGGGTASSSVIINHSSDPEIINTTSPSVEKLKTFFQK
jgi:hypothetical protein